MTPPTTATKTRRKTTTTTTGPNDSNDTMVVNQIKTPQGDAWVIDNGFNDQTLQCIDQLRLSLTLDSKRPTVDRRFFADNTSNSIFFNTITTVTDAEDISSDIIPNLTYEDDGYEHRKSSPDESITNSSNNDDDDEDHNDHQHVHWRVELKISLLNPFI